MGVRPKLCRLTVLTHTRSWVQIISSLSEVNNRNTNAHEKWQCGAVVCWLGHRFFACNRSSSRFTPSLVGPLKQHQSCHCTRCRTGRRSWSFIWKFWTSLKRFKEWTYLITLVYHKKIISITLITPRLRERERVYHMITCGFKEINYIYNKMKNKGFYRQIYISMRSSAPSRFYKRCPS